MPVSAIRPYRTQARDRAENFPGRQLLYVGWDRHLMFYAPLAFCLPHGTPFREVIDKCMAPVYGYHPDWARVDWTAVRWLKSGRPWQPDLDRSLADNGLAHKDVLRFQTPGLEGIGGSGT